MCSPVYAEVSSTLDEHLLKGAKNKKKLSVDGHIPHYEAVNHTDGEHYYSSVPDEQDLGHYTTLPPPPTNSSKTPMNGSFSNRYEVSTDTLSKPPSSWNSKQLKKKNQDKHSVTNSWRTNGGPSLDQTEDRYATVSAEQGEIYATLTEQDDVIEEITGIAPAMNMLYEFHESMPVERAPGIGRSQVFSKETSTELSGDVYSYAKIEVSF